LPTVGEFVPGYETGQWYGVGVPKNTPAEIVDKLNEEVNAGLVDPKLKARLADLGGTVLAGSPLDFGKFIADETEKWAKVIKFAGIRADWGGKEGIFHNCRSANDGNHRNCTLGTVCRCPLRVIRTLEPTSPQDRV